MQLNSSYDYIQKEIGNVPEGIRALDSNALVEESTITPGLDKKWCENYLVNRKWGIERFEKIDEFDKVHIIVGASPAIKNNAYKLKLADENFTIIACNTVLKYLLSEGIKPDYVYACEGNDHIAKDFDCNTEDLTLICSPFVSSKALDKWKGQVYFHVISGGEQYEKLVSKDYDSLDVSGGNAVNTAYLWAWGYLDARHFIFTGTSLSFWDYRDYYLDGRIKPNEDLKETKIPAIDIMGRMVATTPALGMYKVWLENTTKILIELYGGSVFNSTEDGILGVLPKPTQEEDYIKIDLHFLPWWTICPLDTAIKGFKLNHFGGKKNGNQD